MHPLLGIAYAAAGAVAESLAAVAPAGDGKLSRTLRARRTALADLLGLADAHRDPARPLLWMHAPSVGEGLQARPVLERARAERPELQLAYTWFSPSAEQFGRSLDVDIAGVLPFDTAANATALVEALQPAALVCAKTDLWPLLAGVAHARGVPLALVSATLAEGSSRGAVARAVLGDAYAALDAVGAISEADASRLVSFGVRADRVTVTGDTRYDQVWARAQAVDRAGALLAPLESARPTLVAGSTWPSDETPLLAVWRAMVPPQGGSGEASHAGDTSRPRIVIAPHEPNAAHLGVLERWARASSLSVATLGSPEAGRADVVLVDRVGVLGELYALSTVAFVGGGFHSAGLHSVLEPAAFGVPVAFGPGYRMSRDAVRLIEGGGGASGRSAAALRAIIGGWFADHASRTRVGERALSVVTGGLGAADRSWALVARLLDARP